jgi:hypothetical protein
MQHKINVWDIRSIAFEKVVLAPVLSLLHDQSPGSPVNKAFRVELLPRSGLGKRATWHGQLPDGRVPKVFPGAQV